MSIESLLARANKYLDTAAVLLDTHDYASSISRSFYAMLFATRAVLRTHDLDPSTHKGLFTLFNKHFVHTGALPKSLAQSLRRAMDTRQLADYAEDDALLGQAEALDMLKDARQFVAALQSYLS